MGLLIVTNFSLSFTSRPNPISNVILSDSIDKSLDGSSMLNEILSIDLILVVKVMLLASAIFNLIDKIILP